MCSLTGLIWAVASVFVINILQDSLIGVFSSSPVVNELIAKAYNVISIFVFFDCTQGVGQGIIRGLGKQGIASSVTIIGYWVIGIPMSLLAVFYYDAGIVGLWTGPTAAIVFNFIFYYVIIVRVNWHKICEEA